MKVIVHHWQAGLTRSNFGEAIIPSIIRSLGYDYIPNVPLHSPLPHQRLLMIGSELHEGFLPSVHEDRSRITVWGYGHSYGKPPKGDSLDVRAVRGHLTRKALQLREDIPVADPGFLLPRAFPKPGGPLGPRPLYAPHWINRRRDCAQPWQAEYFNVEVRKSSPYLEEAVRQLATAPFVYTNSLHVAILCIAYRAPFAPCLGPEDTLRKTRKWHDVWTTLGGVDEDVTWCPDPTSAREWWERVGYRLCPPDTTRLVEAFPKDILFA